MSKTAKEPEEKIFIDALFGINPSTAIENMEARGQRSFIENEDLPATPSIGCNTLFKDLEALGFEIGEPYEDDPVFRPCKFPKGWSKRATDHTMWNDLLDDKGRVRGHMFFKAASYDRKTSMYLERRFNVRENHDDFRRSDSCYDTHIQFRVIDSANNKPVFSCDPEIEPIGSSEEDPVIREKNRREHLRIREGQQKKCTEWLVDNYPDHEDPKNYW